MPRSHEPGPSRTASNHPRRFPHLARFLHSLIRLRGSLYAIAGGEGDVTLAQAALLHDVIEDTDTTEFELRDRFGPEVAEIVASCTDLLEGDEPERKSPWRQRKERYMRPGLQLVPVTKNSLFPLAPKATADQRLSGASGTLCGPNFPVPSPMEFARWDPNAARTLVAERVMRPLNRPVSLYFPGGSEKRTMETGS